MRLEGAEAAGRRGRWARGLGRLHRRDGRRSHRRAGDLAGRLDRRAVPVSRTSRDLLKTLGVKVEEIKSSPLKAAPNGFEPTSPEARAAIEAIVTDSYAWFKGLVKARRQLDDADAAARRRRPRLHRPPGHCRSSSSTSSATRGRRSPGSPRKRTSIPRRRCATIGCVTGSAICRSCTPQCVASARRGRPRLVCSALRGVGCGAGDRAAQP